MAAKFYSVKWLRYTEITINMALDFEKDMHFACGSDHGKGCSL